MAAVMKSVFFFKAYHLNMFGPRYVWIIIGDYVEKWWEISNDTICSRRQLQKASEGYFTIDSLNSLSDDEKSYHNIVSINFICLTPLFL